ncbi:MAG: hypothetical protein ABFS56_22745 [Pseudomonadota bacterium]
MPVADYLKLDAKERRGKTAFVTDAEQVRLRVEPTLLAVCEERLEAWRTLQELAGIVTPFTAEVEAKLKEQLREGHQAELAALKQDSSGASRKAAGGNGSGHGGAY